MIWTPGHSLPISSFISCSFHVTSMLWNSNEYDYTLEFTVFSASTWILYSRYPLSSSIIRNTTLRRTYKVVRLSPNSYPLLALSILTRSWKLTTHRPKALMHLLSFVSFSMLQCSYVLTNMYTEKTEMTSRMAIE